MNPMWLLSCTEEDAHPAPSISSAEHPPAEGQSMQPWLKGLQIESSLELLLISVILTFCLASFPHVFIHKPALFSPPQNIR